MLNVVVLNGGRGAATLIPALLDRQGLHVTSVVNAYDDGKSTGEIRSFFWNVRALRHSQSTAADAA